MQCWRDNLSYIKTNFIPNLVRNISIIPTFSRQDLKISGFSSVPGKDKAMK